jgi:hypothetical protein
MTTIKLTKATVDRAAPQLKDYELRDTITPGFLLKVSDKCWTATKTRYRSLR